MGGIAEPLSWTTFKSKEDWGARVGQPVKRLILDFSSGHDLLVREFRPHVGLCADNEDCLGILSLFLSPSLSSPSLLTHTHTHTHTHSLSLSQNKLINIKKNKGHGLGKTGSFTHVQHPTQNNIS